MMALAVLLLLPGPARSPAEEARSLGRVSPVLVMLGAALVVAALWLSLDGRRFVLVVLLGAVGAPPARPSTGPARCWRSATHWPRT